MSEFNRPSSKIVEANFCDEVPIEFVENSNLPQESISDSKKKCVMDNVFVADDLELLSVFSQTPNNKPEVYPIVEASIPEKKPDTKKLTPKDVTGFDFSTFEEIRLYLNRRILPALEPRETIYGKAKKILQRLLPFHPHYSSKTSGRKIVRFFADDVNVSKIENPKIIKQKCFWFELDNGYCTDFSVNKIIQMCVDANGNLDIVNKEKKNLSLSNDSSTLLCTEGEGANAMVRARLVEDRLESCITILLAPVVKHFQKFKQQQMLKAKYDLEKRGTSDFYKFSCIKLVCSYSGIEILPREALVVNAQPDSIAKLIKKWLDQEGLNSLLDIELVPAGVLVPEPDHKKNVVNDSYEEDTYSASSQYDKRSEVKPKQRTEGASYTPQPGSRRPKCNVRAGNLDQVLEDQDLMQRWVSFFLENCKPKIVSKQGYYSHLLAEKIGGFTLEDLVTVRYKEQRPDSSSRVNSGRQANSPPGSITDDFVWDLSKHE